MSADDRIQQLAPKILDDASIDWERDTEGLDPDSIEELRALAALVRLHRELPDPVAVPATAGVLPAGSLGQWGPLRLIERIGEGAFGEVFRAWDTRLDREVALKLLHPSGAPRDDHGTAIAEGRLLARVRHPNVVTVFGAERIDGRVGIWTEFVQGRTLLSLVQENGRVSVEAAIAIGADLCQALSAIHAAGVVHGDVKAQNVLQESAGRIVLVDLGTGREHVQEIPGAPRREISGTPLYMAPELWQTWDPTPQSDVYSLGVLLYYLATGTYPVRGETAEEIRAAHTEGLRIPLVNERPDLPSGFTAVVEQALEPDPARRFASAEHLRLALERTSPAAVRRRRIRATLALVAGAIGIGAIALGWSGAFRSLWSNEGAPVTLQPEQLTFQPRERSVRAAAISPDGRFLAYADASDLFVKTVTTNDIRRVPLPQALTEILDLAWVPGTSDVIVTNATTVWRTSIPHADSRQLSSFGGHVAVSRDGRVLAIRDRLRPRILTMSPDGRNLREVVTEAPGVRLGRPSWSPDGRRIAYSRSWTLENGRVRATIATCLADGTGTTTVLEQNSLSLVWTEGRILYSTNAPERPGRSSNLWEVPVDAITGKSLGEPVRLPIPDNLTFDNPLVSHDGSALLFTATVRESHVFVADFDPVALSIGPIRQATFTSSIEMPLTWTPTGDTILFHVAGPQVFRIFRQPIDSPEPQLVIPLSQDWAAASPDGRAIYHVSAGAPWRLLRVPAADDAPEAAFDLATPLTQVKCSLPPASRCVLAQRGTPASVPKLELSWFDPRGGALQRGASVPSGLGAWDITSDGSELAYLDGSTSSPGRLEVVDLTGQRISSVESPSLGGAQFLAWTHDRRGWIVAKRVGDRGGEVFHIDGQARVTTLWESRDMSLTLPLPSPDGRRIAFAAGWVERNVMRLRGF